MAGPTIAPTSRVDSYPRVYPAMLVVVVMLASIVAGHTFFTGKFVQFAAYIGAPIIGTALVALWLLTISRMDWRDRTIIAIFFAAYLVTACLICHWSLFPHGIFLHAMPLSTTLAVTWLALSNRLKSALSKAHSPQRTRSITLLAIALPLVIIPFIRVDGMSGNLVPTVSWRWASTAEDRYLESLKSRDLSDAPATSPLSEHSLTLRDGDWPSFRGPNRDGHVPKGNLMSQQWPKGGPTELWRRPMGPGWSSFAVVDGCLFTQEQRGENEAVVCLNALSGKEIWSHVYPARFYEAASSVGPRATPTFDSGNLFALGATGQLMSLDAATGKLHWQRDMRTDAGAAVPEWGFASSPLIIDHQTLIVQAGESGSKALAYDTASGNLKWKTGSQGLTYGSPQLMTLDGVRQVVIADGLGAYSIDPEDGSILWDNEWPLIGAPRITQPLQVDSTSLVIGSGYGEGSRRLNIRNGSPESNRFTVTSLWTSKQLKPYFNDFVLHKGYLYGFDHEIVTCVDVETGKRQWKQGRYGFGQLLLLADQDLLIVLGEQGQLALIVASPDKSKAIEAAKIQALSGKTWNHPVLAHGILYLRNSEEAVAYRIPPPQGTTLPQELPAAPREPDSPENTAP